MWILAIQRLCFEFIFDILFFPFWWYGAGLLRVVIWAQQMIARVNQQFAPGLWIKNLFVPMFGQTDRQGRLMSIFMRFANFVGRSIALFIWTVLVIGLVLLWVILPILFVLGAIDALTI